MTEPKEPGVPNWYYVEPKGFWGKIMLAICGNVTVPRKGDPLRDARKPEDRS